MMAFWAERCELAVALRWAARLGMQESVDNHFSLAVTDAAERFRGDRFLVNPWGLHWSEVTASSLLLTNSAGEVLEGAGEVETSAFHIHAPIHQAVPDTPAVFHTHMPHATALAVLHGGRLAMCQQNAAIFHDNIAYDDDYNGLALDRSEGERMAARLGGASVLVLGGHGVISVATTVADALGYLYYLEAAARVQILAAATGRPLRVMDADVLARTADQMKSTIGQSTAAYFDYARRTLTREEPEFLS